MSRDFDQLNQAVVKLVADVAAIKDQSATIANLQAQVNTLTAQVAANATDQAAIDALTATVTAADASLTPAAPDAPTT